MYLYFRSSTHYHVFELTRQLPRFSMYSLLTEPPGDTPAPTGWVSLQSKERVQRIVMWMNQNFLLNEEIEVEYFVFKMLEVRTFFLKFRPRMSLI